MEEEVMEGVEDTDGRLREEVLASGVSTEDDREEEEWEARVTSTLSEAFRRVSREVKSEDRVEDNEAILIFESHDGLETG